MAEVNISAVKDVIKKLVQKAAADGMLEEVTIGQTRDAVENELSLEPGVLKSIEYKAVVKAMIETATEEFEEEEEEEEEEEKEEQEQEEKSNKSAPKGKKRKSESSENLPKQTTKRARKTSASKPESATPKSTEKKGRKGGKPKRSPSVVPSDDDDKVTGEPSSKVDAKNQPSKSTTTSAKKPAKEELPKKRRKNVVSEDENGEEQVKPQSKASTSAPTIESNDKSHTTAKPSKVENSGEKSESEMSALIDEPPKRGRKKSDSEKPSKARKKAPTEELSKGDQQIKRLKSLVLACGVRKVWAKEFKDMVDSKSAQIRHLKQILADLGMNGRMSLEQAKAIKEKREFAQELEDVQQFEKSIVSGPRRTRTKSTSETKVDEASDNEMSDIPKKPKSNARNHIMAFLDDQSDSE